MKRLLIAASFALALAACATGPRPPRFGPQLKPAANPSEVIAAELAFARLAQEKGQWAAFRATAAEAAEMFVPQRVKAADWLKGRPEPAVAVKWQPYAVWSSCDGSYAVTRGSWQSPNASGIFATVWQRQRDGSYKWLSDMSLASQSAEPAPEMISASVADCPKRGERPATSAAFPGTTRSDIGGGSSTDKTLQWTTTVMPDGTREMAVMLWKDGDLVDVFSESSRAGR